MIFTVMVMIEMLPWPSQARNLRQHQVKQIPTLSPGTVQTIQQTHITGPRSTDGLSLYLPASITFVCTFKSSYSLPHSTALMTFHTWKDVLVIITVRHWPLYRTRVSHFRRGFLFRHNCLPPWICVRANILGPRLGNVREESNTHSHAHCVHVVPLGPGPCSEYDDVTRDSLSVWILRMRPIEQFGRRLG